MNRLLTVLAASSFLVLPTFADQPATKEPAKKPSEKPADKAPAAHDDKKAPAMPSMEDMAKMAAPGPNHQLIQKMEGSWTTKAKFRMAPDQPWMETAGTCTSKMWYGGRYLHTMYKGDMMGEEFKGMGLMGYDNIAKEFQSTWIDSMSTGVMLLTGTYDAASKSFTLSGDCSCPATGGKKRMKEVVKLTSDNTYSMDFYEVDEHGKEFVSMIIEYTRDASAKSEKGDKDSVKEHVKDAVKDLKDKKPATK